MSNTINITVFLFLLSLSSLSSAHSGRTDSKGGHNCSEAAKRKGLCTGYHYHNKKYIGSSIILKNKKTSSLNNAQKIGKYNNTSNANHNKKIKIE